MKNDVKPPPPDLHRALPHARIAALGDAGSVELLPPAGPSPYIARYGITPHGDDGIVVARVRIGGVPMLVAAQDEHYLGGSVGERHGLALAAMVETARREQPAAMVLLLASGGVRLHEANAAEIALARALAALLRQRGHTTFTATDGEKAVAVALAEKPDVVLIDLGLPKLNGYEVATVLRATPDFKNSLFIAMTGYTDNPRRDHSQQVGIDHHFLKPVDVAMIDEAITVHRSRQRT